MHIGRHVDFVPQKNLRLKKKDMAMQQTLWFGSFSDFVKRFEAKRAWNQLEYSSLLRTLENSSSLITIIYLYLAVDMSFY